MLHIIYFTDPICSACWGIEPQLRKLKKEYGHCYTMDYHTGGLLPSWEGYSPRDIARHWDEAAFEYDMPIDGDVLLQDPLSSSFPPSIAFKAAQMQDREKAVVFLRELRELLYWHKKNIARWEIIEQAAVSANLDIQRLKVDYEGEGKILFEKDLQLAASMNVQGFPTFFFRNSEGLEKSFFGVRPYASFENIVKTLLPQAKKRPVNTDPMALFFHYPTLTIREFAELTDTPRNRAEAILNNFYQQGQIKRTVLKTGSFYFV